MDAQTKLDVTVNSQNGYKLKCGSKSIDYTLDKQSFHVDNIKSSNMKSFNENFDATLSYTDMNFSGSYKDKLKFNIESNVYIYKLDLNSILDGVNNYSVHDYGTADIYINGKKVADDVSDWMGTVHYRDSYEINDIKGTTGHHYSGASDGENNLNNFPLKGKIGIDTKHVENSKGILYSSIFLKFDTNKLTVNYHADGAQTWYHFDDVTYDVSGKDIAASETHLFGSYYDEKYGLGDVSRLAKKGYTAKPNTWIVGKNGTKEVSDNVGLAKSQDVAKYCGVLDEFKKNDVTIDLYPIWIPNTYTLTYDLNGGSFNASTTQLFKFDSSDAISSEIPIKAGYSFTGWRVNETTMQPGDKIPKGWENFTLTAQWKKMTYSTGTVLKIEGTQYIVIGQETDDKYLVISGESIGNMQYQPNQDSSGNYYDIGTYNGNDLPSKRHDGQNSNVYENSYIDKYLETTYYNSLPENLKKAIVTTQIKQISYTNTGSNSKWRCLTKDTNPVSPDGISNWFYNEGTSENPKYVRYDKVTTPDGESGLYPLKYWTKKETGYGGQAYNTITRHVYLPSIGEIGNLVDLNDANKTYAFLKGMNNSLNHMWFRDAYSDSPRHTLDLRFDIHSLNDDSVTNPWNGIRPAFVVDLSKVNTTVVDTVKYK